MTAQTREQRATVEELCLTHGTVTAYPVGNYGPAGQLQYVKCADGTAWSVDEDGQRQQSIRTKGTR